MKALTTEAQRHGEEKKAFPLCLCASVVIFFHGKDTKAQWKTFLPAKLSSDKPRRSFVSSCLCGSLLFRAFCNNRHRGCCKKHKSLEPRRTRRSQRKRKALLCALRVLRGSLLFRAVCDALHREDNGWLVLLTRPSP